jgi:hypothetical protein
MKSLIKYLVKSNMKKYRKVRLTEHLLYNLLYEGKITLSEYLRGLKTNKEQRLTA